MLSSQEERRSRRGHLSDAATLARELLDALETGEICVRGGDAEPLACRLRRAAEEWKSAAKARQERRVA